MRGYKVHRDKLARLGVPIFTSHTILSANGRDGVESVTIAKVDGHFQPIPGTEKTFPCDTVLVAVGLDPVDEFYRKAREFGMKAFAAGDAQEIAEASAAIFSGKIAGRRIAQELGVPGVVVPPEWEETLEVLKSRPGARREPPAELLPGGRPRPPLPRGDPVQPLRLGLPPGTPPGRLRGHPEDPRVPPRGGEGVPGLRAVRRRLPGARDHPRGLPAGPRAPHGHPPHELGAEAVPVGAKVTVVSAAGEVLGEAEVREVRAVPRNDRTVLVKLVLPKEVAPKAAGIRLGTRWAGEPLPEAVERLEDDAIVCRCERVTAGEIRSLIRAGFRDMNAIKAVTRSGMGACGEDLRPPPQKALPRGGRPPGRGDGLRGPAPVHRGAAWDLRWRGAGRWLATTS